MILPTGKNARPPLPERGWWQFHGLCITHPAHGSLSLNSACMYLRFRCCPEGAIWNSPARHSRNQNRVSAPPHRAIPGYEPAKTSTIRDSVNPQTIPSQRSGAPSGAKGNSPGQGTLKACRSPGITPHHQQALQGRQKPCMGTRHIFFIVYG